MTGMRYGYARVSTDEQSLAIQKEALTKANCDVIRGERVSGSSREGRNELETLLTFIREGDTLVVTRMDRLARSMVDFQNIYNGLMARGIGFECTEQPVVNSADGAVGNLMVNMLAAVAQFENDQRRERQAEGIAKAKAEGKYKGGKKRIDDDKVKRMYADGMGVSDIKRALNCSRQSVYRALGRLTDDAHGCIVPKSSAEDGARTVVQEQKP